MAESPRLTVGGWGRACGMAGLALLAFAASASEPGSAPTAGPLPTPSPSASTTSPLAEALRTAQQSLQQAQATHGAESAQAAAAMRDLGAAHRRLAQHAASVEWGRKSLELHEARFGADHPETYEAKSQWAQSLQQAGRASESMKVLQALLADSERTRGPDDTRHLSYLVGLTNAGRALGALDEAAAYGERAVAASRGAHGSQHMNTSVALSVLGNIHMDRARLDLAVPLLEEALAIQENRTDNRSNTAALSMARTLSNLSAAYSRLGQHEKALPMRRRAAALTEQAIGASHPEFAGHLGNLAQSLVALGRHQEALLHQERALAIRRSAVGPGHPQLAVQLNNLSHIHFQLGDLAAALVPQQQALEIRERVLGPVHTDTASSLHNLAVIRKGLGQVQEAMKLELQALAAYEAVLGPHHPSTAQVRAGLADLHARQGERPMAIALLKQTVNAHQAMREQVASLGADTLRSYTDSVQTFYQQLASVLSDEGRLPEAQLVLDMLKEDEQFEFVRRSTAPPGTARPRLGFNEAEKAWAERYSQISGRLAALGAQWQALERQSRESTPSPGRAPSAASPDLQQRRAALQAELAVARTGFESFLAQMRTEFASKGPARAADLAEASQQAHAQLRSLLAGLGEGTALLQVYLTDERVNLLLTTPGVQLARSVPVPARELHRQIREFRQQLRDPRSNPLPAAQALHRLLFAPVQQDLEQAGARTVMLWLDGALRYLPFGALHDGQGYLVNRWRLPVYTALTRERLRDEVRPAWQAAGLGVTRQIGEFEALPAVRTEMAGIIRPASGPASGVSGVLPGEVHLDEAFTAQRLEEVTRRAFPVLHLASHFRFSPGTEADSFLLLGDGQRLSLGEMRQKNLRFDQVDLLTLSACDTALGGGRDERGQEIEGFGVIAQQQGARAVLATLWAVADQSTAQLMADTYRRREQQRLSKTDALRQAQLALLNQPRFAHPFYWAPFILMGNWK